MDEVLMTPVEVARVLRLGRNKTYELLAQGILPCVRFGRTIRVPRLALEAWIAEQATPGGSKPR